MKQTIYAVMRLHQSKDLFLKDIGIGVNLPPGMVGFIPVYSTLEEADKASENGKFAVIPLGFEEV